jgi:hypothetical protein
MLKPLDHSAVLMKDVRETFAVIDNSIKSGAERIWLGSRIYGEVRKFGRDILEIETDQSLLRVGRVGTMYGVPIHVDRRVPPNALISGGPGLSIPPDYHVRGGSLCPGLLSDCTHPDCVIACVMES